MRPSRILIAGAAGFVGSHLTRRLLAEGHSLAVILRSTTDCRRIADVLPSIQVLRADLQDLSQVRGEIAAFRPEQAVDLGWSGVTNRYRNSPEQLTNLAAKSELLNVLHEAGCHSLVGFGSHAEYGPSRGPIREEMATHPTTVYGLAKLCCYLKSREFCASHGLRLIWLRLFSAYGPWDDPSWLLPYVAISLLKGARPSLTAGEQRWDFIHIRDVVDAVVGVLGNCEIEGAFNLGSGIAPPLRSTIERLRNLIDPSLPLGFGEVPYRVDQAMVLQADISRLSAALNWQPRVMLDEGLREIVDWYRAAAAPELGHA